jgi:hypothetical protein
MDKNWYKRDNLEEDSTKRTAQELQTHYALQEPELLHKAIETYSDGVIEHIQHINTIISLHGPQSDLISIYLGELYNESPETVEQVAHVLLAVVGLEHQEKLENMLTEPS